MGCISLSPSGPWKCCWGQERQSGDRTEQLMDGEMDAGQREKMRVQILVGKWRLFSGRVESQAWLSHTALPVFIPSSLPWLLTSFKASNEPSHSLSFSLPPSFPYWPTPSSLSSASSSIHCFILFAVSLWVFLPSLLFLHPLRLFSWLSGSMERCGLRPGPPRFHGDTLCPDVISTDDV